MEVLLEDLTKKNIEHSKLCMSVAEKRRVVSELYGKKIMELQRIGVHISLLKDLAKGSDAVLFAKRELSIVEIKMKECQDAIKIIQVKMEMV